MISSWLIELYLSQIDQLQMDPSKEAESQAEGAKLDAFLKNHKDKLHQATVYSLLKQHASTHLKTYATLLNDSKTLAQIHITNKDWTEALKVIGAQSDAQLYYQTAGVLVTNVPSETITLWLRCAFLNPRFLLPALLNVDTDIVLTYLEKLVENGNEDTVIHNYLLQSYASSNSPKIVGFIREGAYDLQFGLRVCTHHQLFEAVVEIYCKLGLKSEAVSLALKVTFAN